MYWRFLPCLPYTNDLSTLIKLYFLHRTVENASACHRMQEISVNCATMVMQDRPKRNFAVVSTQSRHSAQYIFNLQVTLQYVPVIDEEQTHPVALVIFVHAKPVVVSVPAFPM